MRKFFIQVRYLVISSGTKYESLWADVTIIKMSIKYFTTKHIDYLMTWVQDQLDETLFFHSSKKFIDVVEKTILKQLFKTICILSTLIL